MNLLNKKRRKPYLLLELLVALMLVGTSTVLFLQKPKRLLQAEIASLVNMELQRLSEVVFATIKADLYQHKIPWQELSKQQGGQAISYGNDTLVVINLKGIRNYSFNIYYSLTTVKDKKGKNGEEFKKIKVALSFIPLKAKELKNHKYTYTLFTSALPAAARV